MEQDIYVLIENMRGQIADISNIMLAAGRKLAQGFGSQLVALLLGDDVQSLTLNLSADRFICVDHPLLADYNSEAYQQIIAEIIRNDRPRVVLFGDTSIGAEVAAGLSALLGLPLVSYCHSLRVEDGALKFIGQICGGKIMVEGDLPGPTALVAMIPGGEKPEQLRSSQVPEVTELHPPEIKSLRVKLRQYFEPEAGDIDISKASVLIAVGRGIQNQDNIDLANELAEALGGTVCGSRPVVDQTWLPTTRLVGKSGKRVKPKVYLAMGISGAPEHIEAITDSEVIIAINTDPNAPIFNVAKYGAAVDLFDLAPALIEKVRQNKAS